MKTIDMVVKYILKFIARKIFYAWFISHRMLKSGCGCGN